MDMGNLIASAIISFFISLGVFWFKAKYDDFNNRKRLAKALLTEMQTLLEQYNKAINGKPFLTQDNEGHITTRTMLVNESVLVIYDHNTDKLGLFDTNTIEKIVGLYTNVRGYIYSIQMWSKLVKEYHNDASRITEVRRYNDVLNSQIAEIQVQLKSVEHDLNIIINETK